MRDQGAWCQNSDYAAYWKPERLSSIRLLTNYSSSSFACFQHNCTALSPFVNISFRSLYSLAIAFGFKVNNSSRRCMQESVGQEKRICPITSLSASKVFRIPRFVRDPAAVAATAGKLHKDSRANVFTTAVDSGPGQIYARAPDCGK